IALPATQDTLLMVCFLGLARAFAEGARRWIVCFAVLTYISLPSGLVLLAFWVAAVAMTSKPRWSGELRLLAITIAACVVGTAVLPMILKLMSWPLPGMEYGAAGMLRYFAFLQFTDVSRLLYVAIPAGIFPVMASMWVSRQDALAKALTLVSA